MFVVLFAVKFDEVIKNTEKYLCIFYNIFHILAIEDKEISK